ncbi:MAG: ring-opening amidohydrolase [Tagaea sp.]
MRQAVLVRVGLRHARDMDALREALAGKLTGAEIVAVLAKTPGDGSPADTSRAEFVAAASAEIARVQSSAAAFVVSGGVEGATAPHALLVARKNVTARPGKALAVGASVSAPLPLDRAGTDAQIAHSADAVRAALAEGGFRNARDVHLVQIKGPAPAEFEGPAEAAIGRARAATVLGAMVALGDLTLAQARACFAKRDLSVWTARVSVSSAAEFPAQETIVFGHAPGWTGSLRIAHGALADPLDLPCVVRVLAKLGLAAKPQLSAAHRKRLVACLAKSGPPPGGKLRGVDLAFDADPSQSPLRRVRGGLGSLIAAVTGEPQVFVSGGAEHQGPPGGGIFAAIASIGGRT